MLTVVGPFANHAAADAWQPTPDLDATVDRLIVALHRIPPEPDTAPPAVRP